jgi:hypothetical protein
VYLIRITRYKKSSIFYTSWSGQINFFKKKSSSSDLGPSGLDPGCRVEVTMPGRGHALGGCTAMEDGAEGSVEAARVEVVVGASGGGSYAGWSRCRRSEGEGSYHCYGGWRIRCHRGEGSHHRRSGEGSCCCCRGRRRSRPRFRHPRIVAGELYSRCQVTSHPTSSCRHPRALTVVGSSTGCS